MLSMALQNSLYSYSCSLYLLALNEKESLRKSPLLMLLNNFLLETSVREAIGLP